ncbi:MULTISPECIES: hypothetical protein [Aerococcus]|uniref:Uncharacterized protein n=1 Tax=Aerococcus tenax TaxID=3078812 RepID=A0A329N5V4_9LACT|nr:MULTISPECIES: hypothetical protein [Aerococcus]MDL5184753.1 hypothetical protein [Aerococcus mictus]KAA9238591.1 hypothetical protein F6I34_08080 [Aerococcus urinae]MDK6371978.1 hypothetical protein [Aerococcus urinae]MDK7302418.1 hypothetical protein [Aerococcus urinae]MDK7802277.1 hypothetical protein [Aerococcus urinae]
MSSKTLGVIYIAMGKFDGTDTVDTCFIGVIEDTEEGRENLLSGFSSSMDAVENDFLKDSKGSFTNGETNCISWFGDNKDCDGEPIFYVLELYSKDELIGKALRECGEKIEKLSMNFEYSKENFRW